MLVEIYFLFLPKSFLPLTSCIFKNFHKKEMYTVIYTVICDVIPSIQTMLDSFFLFYVCVCAYAHMCMCVNVFILWL